MLITWWLLLTLIACGAGFNVPLEWREAINALCLAAEKGVYARPSPDAQRMYAVAVQVNSLHSCLGTYCKILLTLQHIMNYIMLPVILCSPLEQYADLLKRMCPKSTATGLHSDLNIAGWADGSNSDHGHPRLLYCVNANVLLISHVYSCPNRHQVLGHHAYRVI